MRNTLSLTRRRTLSLGAVSIAAPFMASQVQAAEQPVLVELFTSQGCSSCPPADRLAAAMIGRPGLHVVSLNVDYWDYLGWHDTLAKPEYNQRQMDYAHVRGDNDVYTPQMVIDGSTHAVGSNQAQVEVAIATASRSKPKIPMSLKTSDTELVVELGEGAAITEATVWLMAIAPAVTVKIDRGENSGSTITYHNVVRRLVPAGMWKGQAAKLTLPRRGIMIGDATSCIATLQVGKIGPVLGLAHWSQSGV